MASEAKYNMPMVRIGEQLREAREKKSVTIDQVQKQTRMHSTVLKALEEGRCDEMLTSTYVKSFLKKYAEYLDLDVHQILSDYAKLCPAQPLVQTAITSKPEKGVFADMRKFLPEARIVLIVVVAAVFAVFAALSVSKMAGRWKASGAAPVVKKAAISSKPGAAQKKAPSKSENPQTPSARKDLPAKEKPSAKAAAASPAATSKPSPKTSGLKLVIRANQTVLVKIKADGKQQFSRVMQRGDVESFTAEDRIDVYAAKGEAVELFMNGRSLGSLGKGQQKNAQITRNGLNIK